MTATPRLALPFLSAGQAQKEFTHNEALSTLDAIVAAAAEEGPLDTPPASPALGACYIVGTAPTDAWAGYPNALAACTSGGWRFVAAFEGMSVYVRAAALWANFRAGAWEMGILRGSSVIIGGDQVVGARAAAIDDVSGGATVDAEARTAISQILAALRQHGLIET
jgi:hypothetical protein